jgi:adenylylsulfate kinase
MKKILVMGLPGSGKTTLANELVRLLKEHNKKVVWFNADEVRSQFHDWDFTYEGRLRQARRMKSLAENNTFTDFVICDFIAPLKSMRDIFDADFKIYMNTESDHRFLDTNKLFEPPENADFVVTEKDAVNIAPEIIEKLLLK